MLDANENSLADENDEWFSRYPDPLQKNLKARISAIKGVPVESIFIGNGSDEAIDLLVRATCRPGMDSILICPPTYGMYEVAAQIQEASVREVALNNDFQLDVPAIKAAMDETTRLLFLCSPNNPTGNLLREEDVRALIECFPGLVVLDEAYIDFASSASWVGRLNQYPNLVILQTLSKAWGLAGARVGLAFADASIIAVLNRIKPPYNVSKPAQEAAFRALENCERVDEWVRTLIAGRELLAQSLREMSIVQQVFPSNANFLLVRFAGSGRIHQQLLQRGIVVRNRSNMLLCEDCLRITVGSRVQNEKLINTLKEINV